MEDSPRAAAVVRAGVQDLYVDEPGDESSIAKRSTEADEAHPAL